MKPSKHQRRYYVGLGLVAAIAVVKLSSRESEEEQEAPVKGARAHAPEFQAPFTGQAAQQRGSRYPVQIGDTIFVYTHIAKTGGASYAADLAWNSEYVSKAVGLGGERSTLRPCLSTNTVTIESWPGRKKGHDQNTCNYVASEGLLQHLTAEIPKYLPRARNHMSSIVLVREPELTVISMWAHCKAARFGPSKPGTLEEWLTHHAGPGPVNITRIGGCEYNPDNFQTHSLGGDGCFGTRFAVNKKTGTVVLPRCVDSAAKPRSLAQTLDAAIEAVTTAAAVGVNEHYDESLCYALAALRPAESLARVNASRYYAECLALKRRAGSKIASRRTHISGNASLEDMTKKMRQTVLQLTEMDRVLYGVALRRLREDLAAIGHPLPWTPWPDGRDVVV
mmetsp:Transcript_14903/g.44231  ORF Transcript_14903/g.44231 Transcript_14903/m.44231 type:complete len:393 (+) Transcript_14903:261-1439(+)